MFTLSQLDILTTLVPMQEYTFRQKNIVQRFFSLIKLVALVACSSAFSYGQSLPEIPNELDFAGVSIRLTPQSRLQVQQEIKRLYRQPRTIQAEITMLRQLTPLLKPLLEKAHLPDDFRFVALPFPDIDTIGFWALTKTQAPFLHLRVDSDVDERYHPVLSTEAVLPTLVRLQKTHHNYALTLIRYLDGKTTDRSSEAVDSTYVLPDPQSPPILWKILARKLAIESEEPTYRPTTDYILFTYQNNEEQTLLNIAQRLRITLDRVKPFNQWLKTVTIPADKDYSVLIQVTPDEFSSVQALAESGVKNMNLRQLAIGFPILIKLNRQTDQLRSSAVYYEINQRQGIQAQNCDNFITLAFYGDITINAFLKFNELSKERDVIRPGQIYYLQRKAKRAKIPFHVAQQSQTLHEISDVYGVRLESLLKFNRMRAVQRLQAGRVVWLRTKRPAKQPIEYVQLPAEEPEPFLLPTTPPRFKQDSIQTQSVKTAPAIQSVIDDTVAVSAIDKFQPDFITAEEDTEAPTQWDTLYTNTPRQIKWHVVTTGQTYYSIARLYGVTVNQLYNWNNLSERKALRVGQKLLIQVNIEQHLASNKPRPQNRQSSGRLYKNPVLRKAIFYTVNAGQNLYRIALQHKVSLGDLMRWNNLKNNTIEVGKILLIWK